GGGGGASRKMGGLDADRSRPPVVVERPFPLGREFHRLSSVLSAVAASAGPAPIMAITMTAELADCFATKREGVGFVIGAFETAFPTSAVFIYGVDGRFRSSEQVRHRPLDVAAANWMATATLVARGAPNAVLIDVGSTTTDIIPIVNGRVASMGFTDPARLRLGELVYTGCLRTPVSAIVRSVPLHDGRCRVAAEHFAIAADVYRWLGPIAEADYTCETPDGRGRSESEAGARLARMVCADREMLSSADITAIADHVARTQTRQIAHGVGQVGGHLSAGPPPVAVIAGSGAFLARAAAETTGLAAHDLAEQLGADAARAVPAAAVAWHLAELMMSTNE